ncbi:MAG: tetratricopeptide repeat protein [Alphaproteobacteria bacterium]
MKNNKKIIFNKIYQILRKKCEQRAGSLYRNYIAIEKIASQFNKLQRLNIQDKKNNILQSLPKEGEANIVLLLEKNLEKALADKDKKWISQLYCHLGAIYAFEDKKIKAIEYYQKAILLNPKKLESYIFCGFLYLDEGKFDDAQTCLEKIFADEFKVSWRRPYNLLGFRHRFLLTAIAYSGLANVSVHQGDLREATIRLFIALKYFEKKDMKNETAGVYQRLGIIYRIAGNSDVSEEMHKTALRIYQELDWKEDIADSYGNLGMAMGVREDFETALEYHKKSLEINEGIQRIAAIASQYENIGITYHMMQQYNLAEENLRKALKLFSKENVREAMARNCENLGSLYEKNRNFEPALYINLQALRLYQEVKDQRGQAECHSNLGRLFHRIKNFEESIKHFNQAINIEKKLGINNVLSTTLNNLGLLYLEQENVKLAEKNLREALDLERKNRRIISIGAIYKNLSCVEKLKENPKKASEYQEQAKKYFAEIK